MLLGELVYLKIDGFWDASSKEVPVGSMLKFLSGIWIRQEMCGMYGYGNPPKCFWTVTLEKRNGIAGVLLPEGDEEFRYPVIGEEQEAVTLVHHQPTFVPLDRLRYVQNVMLVALPPA